MPKFFKGEKPFNHSDWIDATKFNEALTAQYNKLKTAVEQLIQNSGIVRGWFSASRLKPWVQSLQKALARLTDNLSKGAADPVAQADAGVGYFEGEIIVAGGFDSEFKQLFDVSCKGEVEALSKVVSEARKDALIAYQSDARQKRLKKLYDHTMSSLSTPALCP